MALFDRPNTNYPTKWKEYSLDFKLMIVYHVSMMFLFMIGGALSVRQELMSTAFLVAILFSLSIRQRRNLNWRWPGVNAKGLLTAAGVLAAGAFFDFAAMPLAPPSDPRYMPWHLAGLGIVTVGVLSALRIVQLSKSDFLKECEMAGMAAILPSATAEEISSAPVDPAWKRVTRAIYGLLFICVWICGVASFYSFGVAFRDGSPNPTPTQTEQLVNHGQIVYVSHSLKVLVDSLQTGMFVGIPCIMVLGAILHFLVGVKLFPNAPTLAERVKHRADTS